MHNSQQILGYSTIVVTVGFLLLISRKIASAYGSTLGSSKFKYRFEKARISRCAYAIFALICLTFLYGLLIGRDVGLAIGFCALTSFFGSIGCIGAICYVSKT